MRCSGCRGDLFVKDVYKKKRIPNVDTHVVLYYRCGICGYQDSIVIDTKDWSRFEPERTHSTPLESNNITMRMAQLDLETIEYVEDIELFWKAQKEPPLREGIYCDCSDCQKRRGTWVTAV